MVPTILPSGSFSRLLLKHERPKSRSSRPRSSIDVNMLGFKSQWMMPRAWIYSSASRTCWTYNRVSSGAIAPLTSQIFARVLPATIGIQDWKMYLVGKCQCGPSDVRVVERRYGFDLFSEPYFFFGWHRPKLLFVRSTT